MIVLVTGAYNSSIISLIYGMRKYHRLEYTRHIKQMMVNFLCTNLSLILTIAQQVYTF